jgi:hypothetical protein
MRAVFSEKRAADLISFPVAFLRAHHNHSCFKTFQFIQHITTMFSRIHSITYDGRTTGSREHRDATFEMITSLKVSSTPLSISGELAAAQHVEGAANSFAVQAKVVLHSALNSREGFSEPSMFEPLGMGARCSHGGREDCGQACRLFRP